MNTQKQTLTGIALLSFLVLTDQSIKHLVRSSGGFYICNKGIAWGINIPSFLILAISAVLILYLGFLTLNYKFRILNEFFNLKFRNFSLIENLKLKIKNYHPLIFILSGGLSNILDRLYFGCIIDFIDLKFWPIFNLADVFIAAGVIMLIMQTSKCKNQKDNVK